MASCPIANGMKAAIKLPNATSRSARVAGMTRLSPRRTSSELVCRISKFSGISPVSSSLTAGKRLRSWLSIEAVPSGEALERAPRPGRPLNRVLPEQMFLLRGPGKLDRASQDKTPHPKHLVGLFSACSIVSIACPPSLESAGGSPPTTRATRSTNGDRNRVPNSCRTVSAWLPSTRVAVSRWRSEWKEKGRRASVIAKTVPDTQKWRTCMALIMSYKVFAAEL